MINVVREKGPVLYRLSTKTSGWTLPKTRSYQRWEGSHTSWRVPMSTRTCVRRKEGSTPHTRRALGREARRGIGRPSAGIIGGRDSRGDGQYVFKEQQQMFEKETDRIRTAVCHFRDRQITTFQFFQHWKSATIWGDTFNIKARLVIYIECGSMNNLKLMMT